MVADLAGAEMAGQRNSPVQRHPLCTLSEVVNAVIERQAQGSKRLAPYRNSHLTHTLQEALGGRTSLAIIATISPAVQNVEETCRTLAFTQRAQSVMNCPEVVELEAQSLLMLDGSEAWYANCACGLGIEHDKARVLRYQLSVQIEASRQTEAMISRRMQPISPDMCLPLESDSHLRVLSVVSPPSHASNKIPDSSPMPAPGLFSSSSFPSIASEIKQGADFTGEAAKQSEEQCSTRLQSLPDSDAVAFALEGGGVLTSQSAKAVAEALSASATRPSTRFNATLCFR
jgi:hypothetical protein